MGAPCTPETKGIKMHSENGHELQVAIDAQPEMRKGAYSNFVSLQSNEEDCILNFCLLDGQTADGVMTGVLTSRVIMKKERLYELRDAIDQQLISRPSTVEGANEQ